MWDVEFPARELVHADEPCACELVPLEDPYLNLIAVMDSQRMHRTLWLADTAEVPVNELLDAIPQEFGTYFNDE